MTRRSINLSNLSLPNLGPRSGLVVVMLALWMIGAAHAQNVLPLAGTHFTFSIIEGPDNLGNSGAQEPSELFLYVASDTEGCGMLVSPSGFSTRFTFTRDSVTRVPLDYRLMLLNDVGKANKGIVVKTSQPVTLMLHDFAFDAGDATQILPDAALDTSYVVASWGIFNDIIDSENNHAEFVVTATADNTVVTIVPSVVTLLKQPASVPFTVQLARGECYIVKADSNGLPIRTSLTGSLVTANRPVSVVAGLTCAYAPLGVESCNEIMDELLPRSAWGTEFNVRTLSPFNDEDIVFITSDVKNFSVIAAGGLTFFTNQGHVELPITGPEHITASVPVQCHELTEGSNTLFSEQSDPSMVTILPVEQYRDTLLWVTPDLPVLNNTSPFNHYVTFIYPAAIQSQVLLDGKPVSGAGRIDPVPFTALTSEAIGILPGRHILTSPQPISAIAAGFTEADAYTHMAGSVGPHLLNLVGGVSNLQAVDSQIFCREFSIDLTAQLSSDSSANVSHAQFKLQYDTAEILLLRIVQRGFFPGIRLSLDSSVPGILVFTLDALPPFFDPIAFSGILFRVTFLARDPRVSPTTIIDEYSFTSLFSCLSSFSAADSLTVSPLIFPDTEHVDMTLDAGSAILGSFDTATVRIGGLDKALGVRQFVLLLTYDHDVLTYVDKELVGSLTTNWTVSETSIDSHTDQFTFTSKTDSLIGPGVLVRFIFKSYVSDSSTALMQLSSTLSTSRFCPLAIASPEATGLFLGRDLCGDLVLHQFMGVNGLVLNSIIPNPSMGRFTISVTSVLEEPAQISLLDLLGRPIWMRPVYQISRGKQEINCQPTDLAVGRYILLVKTPTGSTSRSFEVVR